MNITLEEYRARLYAALAGYDRNEVEQAVNYYTELIEDAEDPVMQMNKLGTPEQLAQRIIAENGWSPQYGSFGAGQGMGMNGMGMTAEDYRRSSTSGLAKRLLALILTFPFWLTGFILIVTLLIVVWAVFIAFPASTVAAAIESFRWFGKYFGYAIACFLGAIGLAGLTILLFAPARAASGGIVKSIAKFARFLFGKSKSEEEVYEMKYTKNKVSKALLVLGAVMAVIGGSSSVPLFAKAARNPEKFASAYGLENFEYEFSGSAENIKIDIKSGADVFVRHSDNGKMYLKCENVKPAMINVTDSSDLNVTYDYNKENHIHLFGFGNMTNSTNFYLFLPEKVYKNADIRTSLGDIKIESLTAEIINLECKCGDEELSNVKQTGSGNLFTVNNDLGDIELINCTIESASAQIDQSAGDVNFKNGTVKNVNIENDLGDIELEEMTAETLELKNNCGDVILKDTSVTGSVNCKLDLGDADFDLKGSDYNVTADCSLGDIKVNGKKITEAVTGGSIPVIVNNNAGDIKVNFD